MTPEQFMALIVKQPSGCWHRGTGTHRPAAYHRGGGRVAARVAWELFRGPIPDEQAVCHRCDNAQCVNPDHLFLGSQLDNMRDYALKRRLAHLRGAPYKPVDATREYLLRDMPPDLWRQVKSKAALEGTTITALIERLLQAWLQTPAE